MSLLVKKIQQADLAERVITESQLARRIGGTPQRRYSLVNRALHQGELLHLRRGRYLLSSVRQHRKVNLFVLAYLVGFLTGYSESAGRIYMMIFSFTLLHLTLFCSDITMAKYNECSGGRKYT